MFLKAVNNFQAAGGTGKDVLFAYKLKTFQADVFFFPNLTLL